MGLKLGIKVAHKGAFKKTEKFLNNVNRRISIKTLEKYGQEGVDALSAATLVRTGLTAASWYYEVSEGNGVYTVAWKNSNVVNGVPIALILQFGHGTRNGGYVRGRDYINPALQPIFDEMADRAWKEVTSS